MGPKNAFVGPSAVPSSAAKSFVVSSGDGKPATAWGPKNVATPVPKQQQQPPRKAAAASPTPAAVPSPKPRHVDPSANTTLPAAAPPNAWTAQAAKSPMPSAWRLGKNPVTAMDDASCHPLAAAATAPMVTSAPTLSPIAAVAPKTAPPVYFTPAIFRDERRRDLYKLRVRCAALLQLAPDRAVPSVDVAAHLARALSKNAEKLFVDDAAQPLQLTREHAIVAASSDAMQAALALTEYLVFVLEKYGAEADASLLLPVLLKQAMFMRFPRTPGVGVAPVIEGLGPEAIQRLESLRYISFLAVGAFLEAQPSCVFPSIDRLFPSLTAGTAWATQPLLGALRHDSSIVRAAAVHVISEAAMKLQTQLALATEPTRKTSAMRTSGSSFMSLSERMARLVALLHEALVAAACDPTEDSPLVRGRVMNAIASIAQLTPYARCPTSAAIVFDKLLTSEVLLGAIRRPRVAGERIAALFCLTALHRNKFASGRVQAFHEQAATVDAPGTAARQLLAAAHGLMPSLDAFRVFSSLAQDQPDVFRGHWAAVMQHAMGILRKQPSDGPATPSGDDDDLGFSSARAAPSFDVANDTIDRALDDSYQVVNEAVRAVLYFFGPFGGKYSDEQWAVELTGGNFYLRSALAANVAALQDAKQLGVDVGGRPRSSAPNVPDKARLAISKFNLPLSPVEAAARGPSAGARATVEERVGCVDLILTARHVRLEGPRRLALRCLAHLGDAALSAMTAADAERIVRAVLTDGVREPRAEQMLDVLATMLRWVVYYRYFSSTRYFRLFCSRLVWCLRSQLANDAAVVTEAVTVIHALLQRAPQIFTGATVDEDVLIELVVATRAVTETFKSNPVVVGQCLKCLASAIVLFSPVSLHKSPGLTSEVLTRMLRAMDPAIKGLTQDDPSTQAKRALACIACKDCLLSSSVRSADPTLTNALFRRICNGVLLGNSYGERIAACKVIATIPLDLLLEQSTGVTLESLFNSVGLTARFCAAEGGSATLRQLHALETAIKSLFRHVMAHPACVAVLHRCANSDEPLPVSEPLHRLFVEYNHELEDAGVIRQPERTLSPMRH